MIYINEESLRQPLGDTPGHNRELIGFTTKGHVIRITIRLSIVTVYLDEMEIFYEESKEMFTELDISCLERFFWANCDLIRMSQDPVVFAAGDVKCSERLPDTSGYYYIDPASNPLGTEPAAWFNAQNQTFTVLTGTGMDDNDYTLVSPKTWRPVPYENKN